MNDFGRKYRYRFGELFHVIGQTVEVPQMDKGLPPLNERPVSNQLISLKKMEYKIRKPNLRIGQLISLIEQR